MEPALAGAVPIAVGVVVLVAGALQFSAWKTRCLACCREHARLPTVRCPPTPARHGDTALNLGFTCSQCCFGPMAILLVVGVMDLRAMAIVAAAITMERLAPAGERVAWGAGFGRCRDRVVSHRAGSLARYEFAPCRGGR